MVQIRNEEMRESKQAAATPEHISAVAEQLGQRVTAWVQRCAAGLSEEDLVAAGDVLQGTIVDGVGELRATALLATFRRKYAREQADDFPDAMDVGAFDEAINKDLNFQAVLQREEHEIALVAGAYPGPLD